MRKVWWLAVAWLLAAGSLQADWKITTSFSDQGGEVSSATEYYKGDLRRSDSAVNGQTRPTMVRNLATGTFTVWDAQRKMYMTFSPLSGAAAAPQPVALEQADVGARPIELTEISTVETGERQSILGRTARHFVTLEKQFLEETPGAEAKLESETVRDEWYVDVAGFPPGRNVIEYRAELRAYSGHPGQLPMSKTSHTGPVPSGVLVRQRVTESFAMTSNRKFERSMEVTELQETALAANLFAPPSDFKRVDRLPNASFEYQRTLSDEIEMYWNNFENWLFNWFS